jgi:hypothetical protein
MVLIKRSIQPIDDGIINRIIDRELTKNSENLKIRILHSFYTSGVYDWIICFNAVDLKNAKRFVEVVAKLFEGYISDLYLIEELFAVQKSGIVNPEIEKLKEFFGPT